MGFQPAEGTLHHGYPKPCAFRELGTERLGGTGVACGQVLAWLAGGSSLPLGPL